MPLQSYTAFDPSTGRALLQPLEEITFTADRTRLFLRPNKDEGTGTLYITNQHVIWQSLDHTRGYTFDYPYILLHAVCRDTSSFPHPCLYAQLDEELDEQQEEMGVTQRHQEEAEEEDTMEEQGESKEEEDAADEESDVITEMRFVPENPQILDALWSAMSACAALNPDEDAGDDDGEGEEGDFLFDANEISAGLAAMRSGDNMVDADEMTEGGENVDAYDGDDAEGDDGRYDDADEEEPEPEQDEAEQPQSNSRKPAASKPDDAAQVQQQLASATAQVQAASTDAKSSSTAARAKRERQEEEQPTSAGAALK